MSAPPEAVVEPVKPVRVWDGAVRLTHWLIVALVAFSWWSADVDQTWHQRSGYAVIALVVFRIWWGFVGGGAARFSSFLKGPGAILAYMKKAGLRDAPTTPGHNPLGALSVVAILLVLLAQTGTGLFVVDIDAYQGGPMSDRVSYDTGRALAEIHETIFRVLQALIALHVAAVVYYLVWKRTDLIGPMFTGKRKLSADPGFAPARLWAFVVGVAIAGATAWALSKGLRF